MTAVLERLHALAALGRYDAGIDRPLCSPQERAAREHFAAWARDAGFALRQDGAGNVFARRAGRDPSARPIQTGSHLDTVKTGGAYDGAYGVVAALCALEVLEARGIATLHPLEAVAWMGEEGSRFPLGCLGSAVFAGLTPLDDALALRDEDGITLRDALAGPGGALDGIEARGDDAPAAYLELHVEQGPILERAGARLGIVTAIAGQRRYRVTVEGRSGHAGTVPMRGRADPLCAAAGMILALERASLEASPSVVTVGRIGAEPGGTNVIPARVIFSVDARSPEEPCVDAIELALRTAASEADEDRGTRTRVEVLEARAPTPMHPALRAAVARALAPLGERTIDVFSGAGHDAMCLARIAPAAMIFVPSIGGASHVGEERTADADLELGVEALAATLVEVDATLAGE